MAKKYFKAKLSFTKNQLKMLKAILDEFHYNGQQFDTLDGAYKKEYKYALKLEALLKQEIEKLELKEEQEKVRQDFSKKISDRIRQFRKSAR